MARATSAQMAKLTAAVIEQTIPSLKGRIEVDFSRRYSELYECQRQGQKIRIRFSLSPKHPEWQRVIKRCAQSAFELAFTSTTASAIRMRADALQSKALVPLTVVPKRYEIRSLEDAEWIALFAGTANQNGGA